ncbi:MAG: hypothetical protein KGJ62_11150 [Armatimonadetes bacterium]|nr:hypothetical protein [Armatimonadota bacterium]MDE2207861.1 hypothetical protein [Armatimonadota bacterium]
MQAGTNPAANAGQDEALTRLRASPYDLHARAEFCIRACSGLTDSAQRRLPYSYAEFHTDPPIALHAPWDHADTAGRLLEALTLTRAITGASADSLDEALARTLREAQSDTGMVEIPPSPWGQREPVAELNWSPSGALLAWVTRYVATDDVDASQRARRLITALRQAAVWEGDTCWYPGAMLPPLGWTARTPPPRRAGDCLIGAQLVFPLCRAAVAFGSNDALALAAGLVRFHCERSGAFDADGRLTSLAPAQFAGATGFILGALKYGLCAGRDEVVQWATRAFRHASGYGTEFGLFPHAISGDERWQGDICASADMLATALLLGMHVGPLHFAEAERIGRNHVLESQLLDYDWVSKRLDAPFSRDLWCANHPPEGVTVDNVCNRAIGAFSSWSHPNDGFIPANPRIMLRSTAAGARSVYNMWRYAVTRPEGAVMVNLHFSRDTRWATVTSHVPNEGSVEVLMKTRGVLAVRIPDGVTTDQIEVIVNQSRPRSETIRNGYAWMEALQGGDMVTVKWPLPERAMVYNFNNQRYTGYWRGDTLLRLDPPGLLSPLYWRPLEAQSAPPHAALGTIREVESL